MPTNANASAQTFVLLVGFMIQRLRVPDKRVYGDEGSPDLY